MTNLLIIFFPLLVDALNSVAGFQNPRNRFWVSIIVSLIGGMLLNLSPLLAVLKSPNPDNVMNFLTILGLVVTATQGIYKKYWEGHPARASVFTSLVAQTAKSPVAE